MELTDTNRSRAWPSKVIGRMKENISCMQFWRCIASIEDGPVAQLVRAPPCHGGGREFESLLGRLYGIIAQLGEHLPYKQRVIGSSPIGPIKLNNMDGFPSGQRGQTVNLLQIASVVRIHLHPLAVRHSPMWLNWQSSWFVISRLSVRVRSSALSHKT